jgi:hypothetical protein
MFTSSHQPRLLCKALRGETKQKMNLCEVYYDYNYTTDKGKHIKASVCMP